MGLILKPGRLYKLCGKKARAVLLKPDPHFGMQERYNRKHPPIVATLLPNTIFMPTKACLCDNDRWTEIFINETLGWFMMLPTDSLGVVFKEIKSESDEESHLSHQP